MIHPPQPWPRMGPNEMGALSAVEAGDCERLRKILDQCFWEGRKPPLEWEHLRTAIVRGDEPMMRLLITWNLRVPKGEYLSFAECSATQYDVYQKLLHRYGEEEYRVSAENHVVTAVNPMMGDAEFVKKHATAIPTEWQTLLHAFHLLGAKEAVIAGGALRDLFNKRGITDVDIFLRDRGGVNHNKEFINTVFEAAGIALELQMVEGAGIGYAALKHDSISAPKISKLKTLWATRTRKFAESRVIVAKESRTRYNIIFLSGALGRVETDVFVDALLGSFDFGLCRVAYNGKETTMTDYYRRDVLEQRITLISDKSTSKEHLARIVKKYPDWKLCDQSKELLLMSAKEVNRHKKKITIRPLA